MTVGGLSESFWVLSADDKLRCSLNGTVGVLHTLEAAPGNTSSSEVDRLHVWNNERYKKC